MLAQVLGGQGGDPVRTGRLQVLADARRGERAAVADQGDAETLPHPVHLPSQRGRSGRVARKHLDREGQPAAEHTSPNAICCLPLFPSRLQPNAASGQSRPLREQELTS